MFRRAAACCVIPLTIRSYRSKPVSVSNFESRRFYELLSPAGFSTTADDDIAQLIICNVNSFRTSPHVELPSHIGPFPFDITEEDPANGSMTLIRKSQDEIINVQVRDRRELYYTDEYVSPYDNGEYEDEEAPNDEAPRGEVEHPNKKKDISCLYMQVKIYYGPKYERRLKFFVMASRDHIGVRSVVMCDERSHLELFDKYFKDRGIEPNTTGFLFDYFPLKEKLYLEKLRECPGNKLN